MASHKEELGSHSSVSVLITDGILNEFFPLIFYPCSDVSSFENLLNLTSLLRQIMVLELSCVVSCLGGYEVKILGSISSSLLYNNERSGK